MIFVKNFFYKKVVEKGWLIKDKCIGEVYCYVWDLSLFGEVFMFLLDLGILDFIYFEVYEFWKILYKFLFDFGVDMIKVDFGEQLEDDNMLLYSGDLGNCLYNVYSMFYNCCVYEVVDVYCKIGFFLFSCLVWIGSQCYLL